MNPLMARSLLCGLLLLDLIAAQAAARPAPAESKVAALELGGLHPANAPSSGGVSQDGGAPGAPESPKHRHHRPFDKSIAGAEVILGGLATAILAAIVAYIRVTRKRCQDDNSKV